MTIKEAAEYLRMPLATVYYLVGEGKLPAVRIGGRLRMDRKALDKEVLRMGKALPPGVLVLERERNLQGSLKGLLREAGLARWIVESPDAALEVLDNQNVSLCLLSVQVLENAWREVYSAVRQQKPTLPVVLLVREQVPEEILELGAVALLRKPVEPDHFFQALRMMGIQHRRRQAAAARG